MRKRHIAVLVAGILFGTQAGMAADEVEMAPIADNGEYAVQAQPANEPAGTAVTEESSAVVAYNESESAVAPPAITNPIPVPAFTTAPSADDMVWTPLPRQAKYLNERAARAQLAVRGDAFPPSADDLAGKPSREQARFLEERGARVQQALGDNLIPPSADDLAGRLLPAQISYFDQKGARINVSKSESPSSGSGE